MTKRERIAKIIMSVWPATSDPVADDIARAVLSVFDPEPSSLSRWAKVHWAEIGCAFFLLGTGVFVALIFLIARTL